MKIQELKGIIKDVIREAINERIKEKKKLIVGDKKKKAEKGKSIKEGNPFTLNPAIKPASNPLDTSTVDTIPTDKDKDKGPNLKKALQLNPKGKGFVPEKPRIKEGGPQYKVAGNTQARCSKCNHALNVQSEPELTEELNLDEIFTENESPMFRMVIQKIAKDMKAAAAQSGNNDELTVKAAGRNSLKNIYKLLSQDTNPANDMDEVEYEQFRQYIDNIAKRLTVGHTTSGNNPDVQQLPKKTNAGNVKYKTPTPTTPPLREASYKVVAPRVAQDQEKVHAREIQKDPKVNEIVSKVLNKFKEKKKKLKETAYKTQGPSLKTFDDSPQLPDAVNNPKNA